MVVSVAHTVVDENAMMVQLSNASLANATVLGTRWFDEMACVTFLTRMEDGEVIWIHCHFVRDIFWSDVSWISRCRSVQKYVREKEQNNRDAFVRTSHKGPCWGKEENLRYCKQEDEEYLGLSAEICFANEKSKSMMAPDMDEDQIQLGL